MKYCLLTHPFSKIIKEKNYVVISDSLKYHYKNFSNVITPKYNVSNEIYFDKVDTQASQNEKLSVNIFKKISEEYNFDSLNDKQIKFNISWLIDVFSRITFGRFLKIKYIFDNFEIKEVELIKSNQEINFGSTLDCLNAIKNIEKNFLFDSYLTKEIINFFYNKNVEFNFKIIDSKTKKFIKQNNLKKLFNRIISLVCYFNKIVFISTFLSRFEIIKLNLMLFQIPFFLPHIQFNYSKYDLNNRKRLYDILKQNNKTYEEFFTKFFIYCLPSAYIEDFNNLKNNSKIVQLPKKSKIIFSANLFSIYDELKFKISNSNLKIITAQHGSNYGTSSYRMNPRVEEKNSDNFFTWGWHRRKNNITGFNFIKNDLKLTTSHNNISLILGPQSAITYYDETASYFNYINKNSDFLNKLNKDIYKKIIIRPHRNEFNLLDEKKFWQDEHPNIKIDNPKNRLEKILNESYLTIFTYEATSFFQSLNIKKPCIYINFAKLQNISSDYRYIYERLIEANILFIDEIKAINHINIVYDKKKLHQWWHSDKVQENINFFNHKLNNFNKNKLTSLYTIIKRRY